MGEGRGLFKRSGELYMYEWFLSMCDHILPCTIRNLGRAVGRLCILLSGLKGLTLSEYFSQLQEWTVLMMVTVTGLLEAKQMLHANEGRFR